MIPGFVGASLILYLFQVLHATVMKQLEFAKSLDALQDLKLQVKSCYIFYLA